MRRNSLAIPAVLFALSMFAGSAHAQSPVGVIKGVVKDSLGAVVPFAEIAVPGTEMQTFADAAGRFRLNNVPFGEIDLRVRRLGFKPSISTIFFPQGTEPDVELRIVAVPDYLPGVEVRGRRQVYDARLAGFKDRSTKGVGHFISRERLERLHSYRFTDVLREVPGVRMVTMRGGGTTITLRGAACSPLVFVDGFPASAGVVDLDMFDLATVEGIEIYSGMASVPAEFVTGKGGERCGVVAIWSRPYRPKVRAPVVAATSKSRELDSLVASLSVYTIDEVDTPASLIAGTAAPAYPDSLRLAGVTGRVVVELIVNVDGKLDSESVTLVSSTDPRFTDSVQEALATARFRVATLKARPVRQVLQVPFVFRLESKASNR
jgi:TonB family protein